MLAAVVSFRWRLIITSARFGDRHGCAVDRYRHLQPRIRFAEAFTAIQHQTYRDYVVWVIDQSDAQDRVRNEAVVTDLADARFHHIHLPARSLPNARNEGIKRADGRVVLWRRQDHNG